MEGANRRGAATRPVLDQATMPGDQRGSPRRTTVRRRPVTVNIAAEPERAATRWVMMLDSGRQLVETVRAAARIHATSWEALVPDRFVVDLSAEAGEEAAFADLAEAKRHLRDHICETYGVSIRELANLAMV